MSRKNKEDKEMMIKLIFKHHELVSSGKHEDAQLILRLLRRKIINIGLCDDAGFRVEIMLEKMGMRPIYSRNYNSARFELR